MDLSLSQAQDYAVNHNYQIQNSKMDIEAARKELGEIMSAGLPQINGDLSYTNNLELVTQILPGEIFGGEPGSTFEAQFGTQHNASANIRASQMIFNGSYFVGLQTTKVFMRLADENFEKSELEVTGIVTESYYLILIAKENERILQGSLKNLKQNHYEISEMNKEGLVEDTDVDQLQISITQLENNLRSVGRQVETVTKLLKYQMGMDLNMPIQLTNDLEQFLVSANADIIKDIEFNYLTHVDYRIISSQERLAELNLKNEKMAFLPTITATANYSKNAMRNEFNLFDFSEKWYSTSSVGIELNIPLFTSGGRIYKIQEAGIALRQMRNTKKQVEQGLLLNMSETKANMRSSFESYLNAKENRALAQKVYEKTNEKYRLGVSSNMDLIQTHNQYLAAQGDYIQRVSDLLLAKNQLDKIMNNY
ncbi:MAG: TolC family protein [Deltaproteobacteria bacterium]|nr:TolC family protein [Deltaproteobacteria bacterium]